MEPQHFGTVLILRGIPGAGKSTYWSERWPGADNFSADLFPKFWEDGYYNFDLTLLGDAHNWCLRRYAGQLQARRDHLLARKADGATNEEMFAMVNHKRLVVDNTNVTVAEVAPYYQLAQALGYRATILTLQIPWEVAAERCIHDVPRTRIFTASLRLDQESLRFPPWWFHDIVTERSISIDQ